jgi:DNA repair protein RadA/Sms
VVDLVERYDPALLILDALQVLRVDGINRPAGDPAQVRAVAVGLVSEAKRRGMVTFVVVHHTKDASFAGPKLIEHLVDGSFSLLNGAATDQRRLCAPKNRGGDTSEVLRFQMTARGLALVPASSFIEERVDSPGSVVLAATDGAQTTFGLVRRSWRARADDDDEDGDDDGGGTAPRASAATAPGSSSSAAAHASIVCGVLGQHAPVDLSDTELFLQVAGGLDVDDPGADLAIALAIGSSRMDRRVPVDVCAFGELGLGGEVRSVGRVAQRIRDAARQGMRRILVPGTRRTIEEAGTISGIEVVPVRSVAEVFAWLAEQPKHTRVLLDVNHEGSP